MTMLPWGCSLVELKVHGDARGGLVAIEEGADVSFAVRRAYFIFGTTPGTSRGFHAHHSLQQLAVCVAGSCTMIVDDGHQRVKVPLNRPNLGLRIGSPIWREMIDFSSDCVLLVLADALYDEADYIRDYQEFRRLIEADENKA